MKPPFHLPKFVDGFAAGQVARVVMDLRGMEASPADQTAVLLTMATECLRRVNELGKEEVRKREGANGTEEASTEG